MRPDRMGKSEVNGNEGGEQEQDPDSRRVPAA